MDAKSSDEIETVDAKYSRYVDDRFRRVGELKDVGLVKDSRRLRTPGAI